MFLSCKQQGESAWRQQLNSDSEGTQISHLVKNHRWVDGYEERFVTLNEALSIAVANGVDEAAVSFPY